MLIQLLFANTAHFALSVFSAFTFFAAGLLYFDSWQVDKHKRTLLLRGSGFFLLAFVAAFHATAVEIPLIILATQLTKIIGLALIVISLIREPILHPPAKEKFAVLVPFALPALSAALIPLSGVLTFLIAALYFRQATEGLEKQHKGAYLAFFFLSLAELLQIPFLWSGTTVVFWSKMLAPFGPLWNIQHVFEFLGVLILAIWVWGYIRFRLELQLFVSTVALSLILFLCTTFFYTFLLLNNLENDALQHLKTDVNVLQYSLESVKERILAYTQSVAGDSNIKSALVAHDKVQLYKYAADYMVSQKTYSLVIASVSGEVLMRAEDRDRTNDSVSSDPLVASALGGNEMATVSYDSGISVPVISIKAAVPIRQGGQSSNDIVGVALSNFTIDSTFVDSVKTVTGLDIAVFGGDKRAATTFIAPDGKSRYVGTLETNKKVLDTVLSKGQLYIGAANVLNQPFYTAYAPLKTQENRVVGMLFVGKLQNTLTDAAHKSIDLTLLGSIVLILVSLIPAFLFSRFLKEQLEA